MKNLLRIIFNKQEKGEKKEIPEYEEAADFESAITAAGFGKFNVFLIIASIPMAWMIQFETSTMSYVFPAAQCDLSLSLGNKGMLNAITYAGAISSGFLWGILMDNMGRRNLMIICFLLDGLFTVLSSFSQSFTFLMIMKFFGGFIMNGPSAGMTAYLSEIHAEKFRSRVPLLLGFWNSLAAIYLPLLASFIMPLGMEMVIAEWLVLYPWSLYLLINRLPAIVSGLIFLLLPESPKYLMTAGKNDEALKVFQKIYRINTGKPVETYPITSLVEEKVTQGSSSFSFREGFNQIRPLFKAPFLKNLVLICFLQVFLIMGQNTLRLWTPQLFQSINDYKVYNNGSSSNLCEMLKYIQPKNSSECVVITNNMEVYYSSMIVSGTTAGFYILAGSLIGVLGQNRFLVIVGFFAGSFASAIYFSPNGEMATFFIALYSGFSSLGTNGSLIVVVNLFPTALRTVAVSVGMMFGRIASMSGNIIFPYLLEMGCAPPFLFSACALFGGSIMAMLLPKKNENFI